MPHRPNHDPEVAAEQAAVDAAYARLEEMRRSAERVRQAYADVQRGGTHQARLERDIAYDLTERRLAELDIGDTPLVFGRLDLERGGPYHIGRFSVDDAEHQPLVVDWRAPVAEPFYRATAVEPMGVVRRRHILTRRGREVTGLDDEVFDRDATAARGLRVAGEGALLAALERHRTGRMGDIVATIQAEQDEAIRADLPGVLVVTGGPGTGKTAVALHRAAYLLYTHRRRLAAQGVLLVGPGPVFLRYIEQVLPSLGEQDVRLATIPGLKPGVRVQAVDPPAVAAVKGDRRMAAVVAAAVGDRERALPADLTVVLDGLLLRVTRVETARIARSARRRRGPHNAKRPYVARRLVELLVARYRAALARSYERSRLDRAPAGPEGEPDAVADDPSLAAAVARGESPDGWERELAARLRRLPAVRDALERMWPVLSGAQLVHDLFGFAALVRSAAAGILDEREQAALHRRWSADAAGAPWTEADLALVDEADALLGPVEAARPRPARRRGPDAESVEFADRVVEELGLGSWTSGARLAARFHGNGAGAAEGDGAGAGEPHAFGHVLVDEAQDLTAMQWRMLARRCPSGSMTVVGDPAQASRPGALAAWADVLGQLPAHVPPRVAELTVNYRTPAEIMEVAGGLLARAAPGVRPPESVRATGRPPRVVATDPDGLVTAAAGAARQASAEGGTVAVIAPADLHGALTAALGDVGAVADTPEALDAPVAVLGATDAKGLEFDHVVVVEPARLVPPGPAGLRLLYVTITRATRTLTVTHALPTPFEPLER